MPIGWIPLCCCGFVLEMERQTPFRGEYPPESLEDLGDEVPDDGATPRDFDDDMDVDGNINELDFD